MSGRAEDVMLGVSEPIAEGPKMKTKSEKLRGILGSTALCTTMLLGFQATMSVGYAQEDSDAAETDGDTIVVTGARRADRTVGNSMIPIDVIDGDALEKSGTADLTDILRTQVVSLNVQRYVTNDGNVFQRPFTLRGLAPDQTLLLINEPPAADTWRAGT